MIRIKRIYEPADRGDGTRILVDRLWPRGMSKDKAKVDLWLKDIAPGDALRRWFSHEPGKWDEFKRRYFSELESKREPVGEIIDRAKSGTVTLLYGAKDEAHNNAVALREYVEMNVVRIDN